MFEVENHGTIVLIRPLTDDVETWLRDNVDSEAQWFGRALACEPRCCQPLIEAMCEEGFVIQ